MWPNFTGNIKACSVDVKKRSIFPIRVMRLTETRRRNLPEISPPSGKIQHGPVFKALDKPKLAVKRDVT